MELIKHITSFIILFLPLLLIVFFFLTKIYLQSYVSESAKSNIQKRDIEELTEKVESVKAIYTKENELIKYQLNQLLSLKEQHRNEERNALMKFHATYIHWIYLLQGVNLVDYNSSNLDELLEKKLTLNNFFYEIHVARANVLLIVNNQEIIDKTYVLIKQLIAYKGYIEINLLELQHILTKNNSLINTFIKLDPSDEFDLARMRQSANEETELLKKLESLKSEFAKERPVEFLKCRYLSDEFASTTKQYLISID